jgi:hypothetical protein
MSAKATSKAGAQQQAAAPRLRKRWANLPVPPDEIRCLWAKARAQANAKKPLSDDSAALWTILVMESPEWHDHIEPILTEIDSKRRADFLYSSRELESVFLFSLLKKGVTIRDARDKLAGDRQTARLLLGFDKARNPEWRAAWMERLDGVPSEATLSRHLARFDEKRRLDAYRAAGIAARDRHLTYDDFVEALLILLADGTKIETCHVPPHVNKKTGEVLNEKQVTAWDAGYVSPKSAPPDHSGAGWNHIAITTLDRIPVVMPRVVKLQRGETTTLAEMIDEQLKTEIAPLIGDRIGVIATDSGFFSPHVSHAAHSSGYLVNNHASSHASNKRTQESVSKKDATKYSIYGYPNWYANGHREVFCKCGRRATKKNKKKDGIVYVRVEGACAKCGTISLKCGDRFFSKGFRLVPNTKTMSIGRRDYALGNGLTYNDPISEVYGKLRHAHGEGYNQMLAENFGFNQGRKRYRRQIQAETAAAIAFFAIHIKAMDQRDQDAAAAQNLAPPDALAA